MTQPTIDTRRLLLRPFRLSDSGVVQWLAGERDIADTTLNIPHPYEDGMAEAWIETQTPAYDAGELVTFAVVARSADQLVGAMGLVLERRFKSAELGYWIGKPFWNQGYATEAADAVIRYGFDELRLNRISARHFARNPSSGRVMEKVGMLREGKAREAVMKWGKYEDLVLYGIVREDKAINPQL